MIHKVIKSLLRFIRLTVKEVGQFKLRSFLLGEKINKSKNLPPRFFEGKSVYMLGAGPSLDEVELSEIHDSAVIFLNTAYRYSGKIHESNDMYWFCQDTERCVAMIEDIPYSIRKIITVDRYRYLTRIEKHLNKNDLYLHPSPALRRDIGSNPKYAQGGLGIKPTLRTTSSVIQDFPAKRVSLLPKTVMFTAISFAAGLGAKDIICLGFDVSPKIGDGNNYCRSDVKYAANADPGRASQGWELEVMECYLGALLEACNNRGIGLYNCSPSTSERILPKIEDLNSITNPFKTAET